MYEMFPHFMEQSLGEFNFTIFTNIRRTEEFEKHKAILNWTLNFNEKLQGE